MTSAGSGSGTFVSFRNRRPLAEPEVEYTRVSQSDPDTPDTGTYTDQLEDDKGPHFQKKIPLKQVFLIFGFMILGVICITFSILISTSYFDAKYEDRVWPLLMVGILMFIPGGYYGYILICILFKRDGYTNDDVPIF